MALRVQYGRGKPEINGKYVDQEITNRTTMTSHTPNVLSQPLSVLFFPPCLMRVLKSPTVLGVQPLKLSFQE